jgi:hypothetical protein
METADRNVLSSNQLSGHQRQPLIPCGALTTRSLQFLEAAITFLRGVNIPPPLIATMTLLRVEGYELATSDNGGFYSTHPVDRDDLLLPAVLVQDFGEPPADILRPIFDALYNAAGRPRWTG